MRVCFPVKENKGVDSVPFNHFGTAPLFLIYDTEKEELKEVKNGDLNHQHGMCHPMKALSGEAVDVILVGGIGAGAINKLTQMGIKVYRAASETVLKNIQLLKNNELEQFSANNTCNHHDCQH